MLRKIFFMSSVMLLFLTASNLALADVSEQLEQAQTHQSKGQYEQAEAIYQQIITDFPDTNDALEAQKQLTIIYIATDKQQKADAAFKKLVADFSKHKNIAKAVYQIARKCYESKKYEKADPLYKRVLDTWPEDAYAMWSQAELAKLNILLGNEAAADAAVENLFATASRHKDTAEAVYYVARKYYDLKKYEKAEPLYNRVLETWSDDTYAMWSQADLVKFNILLGNEAAADAAIEKLLATFSKHKDISKVVYQIARKYQESKKYEKAGQLYQCVIDRWPDSKHMILVKVDAAKLNISLGNEAVVQTAIDKLIADFNDHPYLHQAVFQIGEEYHKKALVMENEGRNEQAADCFEKAVKIWDKLIDKFPNSAWVPQVCCWAGDYYYKLGRYEKSTNYFQTVVDSYPDYTYAWHALFMVGRNIESLKESGVLSESEANPQIEVAYQQLLRKYPDCQGAEHARDWMEKAKDKP